MKWRWIILLLIFVLAWSSFSHPQTRDPGKTYKVAILPFVINSRENLDYVREGIYNMLSSRITVEGRIEVIDRATVERALYDERPTRLDEATAGRIGKRAGADYIVLGSLTKIGDYISLDARMISITEDRPPLAAYTQHRGLEEVMVKIDSFSQEIGTKILGRRFADRRSEGDRPGARERGSAKSRSEQDYKKSQTFPFEIRALDVADVDGDKKNEVVIMDASNLFIFKYVGETLSLFRKVEVGHEHNLLTLDVADVNRNGLAEIIVTSVVGDNLRSFILEFEEGRVKKIIDDADWFFRVLHHPQEGAVLMGQKMDTEAIVSGPIYKMNWKNKLFERGSKMSFPRGTQIFSVAMGYFRDPKDLEYVTLDEFERLSLVSSEGKVLWTSSDRFGGRKVFYETTKKRDITDRPRESIPWRVYITGRILVKDVDGDGINEVIVARNQSSINIFSKIKLYEKGDICELVWEDNAFVVNWKSREVMGYISGFQARDVDHDGEEDLVVAAVNPSGGFDLKETSNILFFRF